MRLLRAWTTLVWLSFTRLLWSLTTFMILFPLLGAGLFAVWMQRRYGAFPAEAFVEFSEHFVVQMFTLFVLPICALAYATSSIGGDREDRTLLFLLVRPVPRWLIVLAKVSATMPLVVGITVGSFWVYCRLLAAPGEQAFRLYLPSVLLMSVAYVCLFHLLAVLFRYATIVALLYALFMEALLGSVPGVIKQVAVSYYGRSMMYQQGRAFGLEEPELFESASSLASAAMLGVFAVASLLLALYVFQRREYRDLA